VRRLRTRISNQVRHAQAQAQRPLQGPKGRNNRLHQDRRRRDDGGGHGRGGRVGGSPVRDDHHEGRGRGGGRFGPADDAPSRLHQRKRSHPCLNHIYLIEFSVPCIKVSSHVRFQKPIWHGVCAFFKS